MKKIFFTLFFTFSLSLFSGFFSPEISAHMVIPEDIMTEILNNPDITDEEIEAMFTDRYGMTAEKYTEKKSIEDEEAYRKSLEGDPEYDTYINQLNTAEKTVNDTITVEKTSEKTSQNPIEYFQEQERGYLFDIRKILMNQPDASFLDTVKQSITAGMYHIWGGIDHMLFFLTLLLIPRPFRKTLLILSVFTLAHSLTLLLVGGKFINVNLHIIEIIIAFSIVWSATFSGIQLARASSKPLPEKTKQKYFFHTVAIIFIFGLFHGMGFAEVFDDFHLTFNQYWPELLMYNAGIEMGQIILLIILYPVITFIHSEKWGKLFFIISSALISVLACLWVVERM